MSTSHLAEAKSHEARHDWASAELAYRKALAKNPSDAAANKSLAVVNIRLNRFAAARTYLEKSIALAPAADSLLMLAALATRLNDLPAALSAAHQAACLAPKDPAPHIERAKIQIAARAFPEAETALRAALDLAPGHKEATANLGSTLFMQARFEEAIQAHQLHLRNHPAQAIAWKNLAAAERAIGDFPAARAHYLHAIKLAPDLAEAHRDLALLDLLLGDTAAGFARYEWRFRAPTTGAPLFPTPRWDGSPAAQKTLLLHWEQGIGDTIQFLRYLPAVLERVPGTIVCVPKGLEALAASLPGGARIVTGPKIPRHDMHAYLLSLPHLLGPAPNIQPVPYLVPPAARVQAWKSLLPPQHKPRIGITWSGNPLHENDHQRSLTADELAILADLPHVQFFALQPATPPHPWIASLPAPLSSFAETASAIMQLDLVISVDTAAAHLAGALGRPAHLLLPKIPDWRWGREGQKTPWYPTLRLHRQTSRGDWATPLAKLKSELAPEAIKAR